MKKTLKEISNELGYSFGTVSRAINNKKGVSEKTRLKILSALNDMNYQPNRIAQSLAKQRSNLIGVILPDISNGFFSTLMRYLEEALESVNYHMLLFNTDWDTESEQSKISLAQANQVDGIILKPIYSNNKFKKYLKVPTVLISQEYDDSLSWVDIDNFQAGYLAAKHLINCGYKRIAFISCFPESNMAYIKRRDGYIHALNESGLIISDDFITFCMPGIESGYEKAKELFSLPVPPDAAFFCDDFNAFGCLAYAKDHSIQIPSEFGITGCNDTVFSSLPQLYLTSISQSLEQMALSAVTMITNMIDCQNQWHNQKIILSPSIICRSSTKDIADKNSL